MAIGRPSAEVMLRDKREARNSGRRPISGAHEIQRIRALVFGSGSSQTSGETTASGSTGSAPGGSAPQQEGRDDPGLKDRVSKLEGMVELLVDQLSGALAKVSTLEAENGRLTDDLDSLSVRLEEELARRRAVDKFQNAARRVTPGGPLVGRIGPSPASGTRSDSMLSTAGSERGGSTLASRASELEKKLSETAVFADKAGWLYKEGRVRKTWKRRWFVLHGSTLSYFKSPDKNDQKPKGTISLETCVLKTATLEAELKILECLVLITEGRKLYFYGDDPKETALWVVAINNAISCASYVKKMKMQKEECDHRVVGFFNNADLAEFSLSGQVSLEAIVAISQPIRYHQTLVTLTLNDLRMDDVQVGVLCAAIAENGSLETLRLAHNSISARGAKDIGAMLERNKTLTELALHSNALGDEGASAVAQALPKHRALTNLTLDTNTIGDDGICALANALCTKDKFLGWPSLPVVAVSHNNIGDKGAKALAAAITVNPTVTFLRLNNNQIGDEGVISLCRALKTNKTVAELELKFNRIGKLGCQGLATVLKFNHSITALDVGHNELDGTGLAAVRILWETGLLDQNVIDL